MPIKSFHWMGLTGSEASQMTTELFREPERTKLKSKEQRDRIQRRARNLLNEVTGAPAEVIAEEPEEFCVLSDREDSEPKPVSTSCDANSQKEETATTTAKFARSSEQSAQPPAEKPADPVGEKPAEPVTEKPADPVAEKQAEPAGVKPAEPAAEKPADPVAEKPAEPAEKPTDPVTENPADPVAEKQAEPAGEKPAEHAGEKPAEPVAEKQAEPSAEKTTDPAEGKPVQLPGEQIAEPSEPESSVNVAKGSTTDRNELADAPSGARDIPA